MDAKLIAMAIPDSMSSDLEWNREFLARLVSICKPWSKEFATSTGDFETIE